MILQSEIAIELAMTDEDYVDMVLKFLEHDAWITPDWLDWDYRSCT